MWDEITYPIQTSTAQPFKFGNGLAIYPTFYWVCEYLSMLGLELNHVSKWANGQTAADWLRDMQSPQPRSGLNFTKLGCYGHQYIFPCYWDIPKQCYSKVPISSYLSWKFHRNSPKTHRVVSVLEWKMGKNAVTDFHLIKTIYGHGRKGWSNLNWMSYDPCLTIITLCALDIKEKWA